MAERVLPSRLYRIDRDMGEIAWTEGKDTALDDVERAIRMGVLVPVNREAIDMEKAYRLAGMIGIDTPADVDRFFAELGLVDVNG